MLNFMQASENFCCSRMKPRVDNILHLLSTLDKAHEQQPSKIMASALGACNNCFHSVQGNKKRDWLH